MSEVLKFKGRLQEAALRLRELKLRIEGLVGSIRDQLDPLAEIEDLRCDIVAEQAVQLADLHIQHQECVRKIDAINKALGR